MPKRTTAKRTPRGYHERITEARELRQRFLIVCEGTRTEPNYFLAFRVPRRVVPISVRGLGCSPSELVKQAIRLRREENYTGSGDQVWCVFDRDEVTPQEFNAAITDAEQVGIGVAYSNQAFELWYLLHFNYYNTAVSRAEYQAKLSNLLQHVYEKNSQTIYAELLRLQPTALANAARLLEQYDGRSPAGQDPSTTVHLLVQQLNRFAV